MYHVPTILCHSDIILTEKVLVYINLFKQGNKTRRKKVKKKKLYIYIMTDKLWQTIAA